MFTTDRAFTQAGRLTDRQTRTILEISEVSFRVLQTLMGIKQIQKAIK